METHPLSKDKKCTESSQNNCLICNNFIATGHGETPSEQSPLSLQHHLVAEPNNLNAAFRQLCSFGYTGETYYDYDKGLDPDDNVVIIHFNDVYNVESQYEGSGGISRFISALKQFSDCNPLILFSGDAFNPSIMSSITKGRHMVPFLNMLKIHTACIGNHDFDFGIDHLEYLTGSTRFPWILSNVFDAYSPDRPLAGANLYRLFEWQGHRIGIIGLVEQEWISTLSVIEPEDLIYKDFVKVADELSAHLRSKECELIIALTHMRAPNDERLAREAKDLDLILGGHDHEYYGATRIGKTIVCKSGTDFKEFSVLKVMPGVKNSTRLSASIVTENSYEQDKDHSDILKPGNRSGGALITPRFCGGSVVEWDCITVTPDLFESNCHVDRLVARYLGSLENHMSKLLGETAVPLETRFGIVRRQETNVGNWLADLLRANFKSDIAFFNAGTIRSDRVIPVGLLYVRDLFSMLPMPDELVVIQCTGEQLIQVIENSVSQYPKTEGRFLQISGFRFVYDSSLPQYSRVVKCEIQQYDNSIDDFTYKPVKPDDLFSACTKLYLAQGKDGYDILTKAPILIPEENLPNLQTLVRNSFNLAALANGVRKPRNVSTLRRLDTFKAMTSKEQTLSCGITTQESGIYKLNCAVEGRIINLADNACIRDEHRIN